MTQSKPRLSVVSSELPEPPYPQGTTTKGWRFEMDLQRIWKSDTWVLCQPDMRPWLYHVWAVAFEQDPAGSLPGDHALIAAHLGMDARMFSAHADILLRGFVLHADGRLYHQVVVDRVKSLLDYRDLERERKAKYRAARAKSKKRQESCPTGHPRDTRGNPVGETLLEQEQEQEEEKELTSVSSKKKRQQFVAPSLEEVRAYIAERGSPVDPEAFHAHYEAANWFRGKTKIANWKQCVVTWEKNSRNNTGASNGKPRFRSAAERHWDRHEQLIESVLNGLDEP